MIKSETADQLVIEFSAEKSRFEKSRMGVGSIEDCKVFGFGGSVQNRSYDLVRNMVRFVAGRGV